MNVLVVNCGSSSLKFQLRHVPPGPNGDGRALARGRVQGLGREAELTFQVSDDAPQRSRAPVLDHAAAVRRVLDWLERQSLADTIMAVGHRFVHGGARFTEPVRIDPAVRAALDAMQALAPLHNGPALAGLEGVRAALGEALPQVAVFDTAFHATLPEVARTYALPHALTERHGIRRFGFHGTSCRSVLAQYSRLPGAVPQGRLLVLHLGSGCSATAVREGRSLDTSMGYTPLEGLLMGTRCGDLDPALPLILARLEGLSLDAVEALLNEQSGLLGVSGRSADLRELLAREGQDARARLAVALFCYRVRKAIGAAMAVLEGLDAVLFTGGIGEHQPVIRARICGGMAWCGLRLDEPANAAAHGGAPARISANAATVRAWVIPSDEERVIACDTARRLGG